MLLSMPRRAAADHLAPVVAGLPRRLKPPENLSDAARAEFLRIVTAERADHFRKSDLSLLVQYCEACALAEKAMDAIRRDLPGPRHLATWQAATKVMKDLALRLRLSPQSRQPTNPKRPEPRLSYYEQMRLSGDLDDAESDTASN
jgi:phage terminase small subunit